MELVAEHNLPEDLGARALEAIDDVLAASEFDEKTGELILWGRWTTSGAQVSERFDHLDDVLFFLENFGWSIETDGKSKESERRIHFKPFGKRRVLKRSDIIPVIQKYRVHEQIDSIIDGDRFYSVRETVSQDRLQEVRLELVTANDELLSFLKRHPKLIHTISPRRLEEIVGDIFSNMGYDVELTPQTRDGGYDIRALRKDKVGTFLYLVECKRFAPNRPVGVELVRALHGTVSAARASHGVMATTSYYSPDAKEFADQLKYQMSLRDYADLTKWIADISPLR